MSDYVVIPDIHNRIAWAELVASQYPNHTKVFLGDYFDDFNDGPTEAKATAEWLRWSIYQPERIHLFGNHDLPYCFPTAFTMCPGCKREKHAAVVKIMKHADWGRLKLYYLIHREAQRPLLISHAGFTIASIYGVSDIADTRRKGRLSHLLHYTPDEHLEHIAFEARRCRKAILGGRDHPWLNQGSRMGRREAPGPFWVDKGCLGGIVGIDQMVGHTQVHEAYAHAWPSDDNAAAINWFIDGGGSCAAVIEEGNITPIYT